MKKSKFPEFPKIDVLAMLNSPEHRKAVEERMALMLREESVIEAADWFGKTGLGDSTEREMPRYLRREFGETMGDPKALKAADLKYLGEFVEQDGTVHYWQIPAKRKKPVYAYVEIYNEGPRMLGWGGRKPPDRA